MSFGDSQKRDEERRGALTRPRAFFLEARGRTWMFARMLPGLLLFSIGVAVFLLWITGNLHPWQF